ncbi:hypothetical protein Back2_08390 [Nocardioides baekrokdamisoli]|uniref:Uncharacterized protein n=1 Tax=Nocardioides baekrokdamisoli TaxID=1804624 RepID=A0A3G9IDV8_9ACTN|nr:hypothetical protein [Nocardioides baekrokdamisoli]BBH16552.1 hypothetical protein Back2_08390 [Nocardioides baekrokdamisoli]
MTSSTRTAVRRVATLSVASLTAFALMSAPALADVPSGWSHPPHVSPLHFLAVIVLIPLGLALVIAGVVLLPGILKGEGLLPKPFPKPDHVESPGHH